MDALKTFMLDAGMKKIRERNRESDRKREKRDKLFTSLDEVQGSAVNLSILYIYIYIYRGPRKNIRMRYARYKSCG